MVRRILKSLSQPVRGLHQAAYLLATLTLASQALALVRDRIFAHQFGAGEVLDLYYASFRIPDVTFALIASLVSAYVLVPRIQGKRAQEIENVLSQSATFFFVVAGCISALLYFCAPFLLTYLFPTISHGRYGTEFIFLTRILLLQPLLLGLSSILSSVTQKERKFVMFALSPVLYNIGIILGSVVLYPYYGVAGIGYGVVLGALAHLLIHIPVVIEARTFPRPRVPQMSMMWSIVKTSVPRSLALGMSSVITLLLISLASRISAGSVAVYTLAGNLASVPLSLIGASYATAAFPVLSDAYHRNSLEEFRAYVTAAARHIIFWCSVVSVLTIVLRAYIVRIIYGTGAFDWNDTRLTAAVLAILIVGLLAQCLILLSARAFYAAGRSWNPLMVQLADFGISVASAWGLVRLAEAQPMLRYFFEALFRVSDVPGTEVLFIALGFVLGQVAMALVALMTLRSVAPGVASGLGRPMGEGLGAAILGGTASYGVLTYLGTLAPLTSLSSVFIDGALSGMVGLIVSGCVLLLFENQEFKDLLNSLKKTSHTTLKSLQVVQDVE